MSESTPVARPVKEDLYTMRINETATRLLGGLTLVLALLASTLPAMAQDSASTVTIHKRDCPTGYAGDAYYEDCHDNPGTDITFTLDDRSATTGANGDVTFRNVSAGRHFVSENIPGEFVETNIYCSRDSDGREPVAFQSVTGGIELQVPANADVICDWYNTPYNLRGAPPPGAGQDGDDTPNASVLIRKASCPADVAPENRFAECFENPQRGVTFTLDGITTTTGADGDALFYQLQPGTYSIRETLPGGFADFAVFCTQGAGNQQVDVTRLTNGIRLFVPQDTEIICDWYNIREPQGDEPETPSEGIVTIHKLRCPAGYEGTTPYQDCHDNRFQGVTFTALGPEGYVREETTGADGVIVFDGITVAGTVNLAEELPSDIASFRVYCSNDQGNRVPSDRADTAAGPGVRLYVGLGDRIICDWYDIPAVQQGANASVTIHKRLCPTGYGGPDYYETCHGNPQEGIAFALDGLRTTTGENGNAVFFDLQAGMYTIVEETLPGDAVDFRTYCSVGGVTSREAEYSEVSGGIELTVPQGATITCDWYNIPADLRGEPDAGGNYELPILKLRCEQDPGQVNPLGLEIDGLPEGCAYDSGVLFTAIARNGAVSSQQCTTGDDGRCFIAVDVGATVTILEHFATGETAYFPRESTVEITIEPNTDPIALFVNLPIGVARELS
ncbi:MAG: hypothetical protein KY456_08305 [Chloroflexi bacterium]|nr:hypothetical protein [Chloroflexota bacterium]